MSARDRILDEANAIMLAAARKIDEAIKDLSKVMVTVRQRLSEVAMVPAGSAN